MQRKIVCLWLALVFLSLAGCAVPFGWPFDTRPHTYAVALGDLDGDGDVDAYLANGENEGLVQDVVWLNDGQGRFMERIVQPYEFETHLVELADLDGDGDLDGVLAVGWPMAVNNRGDAHFVANADQIQLLEDPAGAYVYTPALGDLDDDGDLDLVLGGCCGGVASYADNRQGLLLPFNRVLFNDGRGQFVDSGQLLGRQGTSGLALGDVDDDGDLDYVEANSSAVINVQGLSERNQPNRVWLNDGAGTFSDSGQLLGRSEDLAVALGDLDGDGDLDAFFGGVAADTVWLNDGAGTFSDSGQILGQSETRQVQLFDLDGDGDLDAFCAGPGAWQVWLNQRGVFEPGARADFSQWYGVTAGDLDGDGDADVFAGLLDQEVQLWLNDGHGGFESP